MTRLRPARNQRRTLGLEQLESRQMLSVTDLLNGIIVSEASEEMVPDLAQPYFVESEYAQVATASIEHEAFEEIQLVLNGDGFFLVQNGSDILYTRNGSFEVNDLGQLLSEGGLAVLGYGMNEEFEVDADQLVPLRIPVGNTSSHATELVETRGVLNPAADIGHTTATNLVVYDSLGQEIALELRAALFAKYSNGTEYSWEIHLADSCAPETLVDRGSLFFDANGDLAASSPPNIDYLNPALPAGGFSFVLDFSEVKSLGETNAQGEPISSLTAAQSEGFPPGLFDSFIVAEDGVIHGLFENGQQVTVGQLVVATFANPHGLEKVGRKLYDFGPTSGSPTFGIPGEVSLGNVVALPESYRLSPDGQIYREGDLPPNAATDSFPLPAHPHYPWLIRSVNLKIQGNELFILEGKHGETLYARDGRFRLNSESELVTYEGLRVLGYVYEESGLDTSHLAPLEIPLGAIRSQQTSVVTLSGNLSPVIDVATQPGILRSAPLGNSSVEAPRVQSTTVEVIDPGEPTLPLSIAYYRYYVTYYDPLTDVESRPIGLQFYEVVRTGQQVRIAGLPPASSGNSLSIRIYRNNGSDLSPFYRIAELPPGVTTYVDTFEDSQLESNPLMDWIGAKALESTRIVDVLIGRIGVYVNPFSVGQLTIAGMKGGVALAEKTLSITEETTLADLLVFIRDALAIGPSTETDETGEVTLVDGRIRIVSNLGVENEISIRPEDMRVLFQSQTEPIPASIEIEVIQNSNGPGSSTALRVYDRLGSPIDVQISTYLETRDTESTSYRWIASLADTGSSAADASNLLGSGLLSYDSQGNLIEGESAEILVTNALGKSFPVSLNFGAVENKNVTDAHGNPLNAIYFISQDGYPPGALERFSVSSTGEIQGQFTSGLNLTLGRLQLARFRRAFWLKPLGDGILAETPRSGEPEFTSVEESGIGEILQLPADSFRGRAGAPKKDHRSRFRDFGSDSSDAQFGLPHDLAFDALESNWTGLRSRLLNR